MTEASPAFRALFSSLLQHLQQPSYPLALEPAALVSSALLSHLPYFTQLPAAHLLPAVVQLLSSSLPRHQLTVLTSHLHCHTDALLCSVLSSRGFAAYPSIPHIVDDEEDEDEGGAHSIRGISGGSVRLFPDAHTARLHCCRCAMQRAAATAAQPQSTVLLLPSIPNAHPWLDRLLFELGLPPAAVRFISVVPYLSISEGAAVPRDAAQGRVKEGVEEEEDAEHINPLLTHHMDAQELQATLAALPASCAAVVMTLLGSGWEGGDEVYYSEQLQRVKDACHSSGRSVWLHVEGDMLWKDEQLDARQRAAERKEEKRLHVVGESQHRRRREKETANGPLSSSRRQGKQQQQPLPSLLHQCADSIVFSTSQFSSGRVAVAALKERPGASPGATGAPFPIELDAFPQLMRLWFDLSQAKDNLPSLLSVWSRDVCRQLAEFRHSVLTQRFSVYLISPVGEQGDGGMQHSPSASPPSSSLPSASHTHLFFQLSVSPPHSPASFNLTVNDINTFVAHRLALRAQAEPSSPLAALYGSVVSASNYFDLTGFVFRPAFSLSTLTGQGGDSSGHSPHLPALFAAVAQELEVLDATAAARAELQQLLAQEQEFAFVPLHELQGSPRVGLGAVRFLPSQVPESAVNDLAHSLNRKLRQLPSAMQPPWPLSPFPSPQSGGKLVSLFRPALTVRGEHCVVLDVTEQVVTRGVQALLSDIRTVAAHLALPRRVMADVSQSVQRGIAEAERKLDEATAVTYGASSLVRWIPIVGNVVNWWSAAQRQTAHAPCRHRRRSLVCRRSRPLLCSLRRCLQGSH